MMSGDNKVLEAYTCPSWGETLANIPTAKVSLARHDTPIHAWDIDVPDGFSVSIKRDDLTGSTLSGTKIRKLEFLLADAIQKGCKHVITCGAVGSNHCRTTSVASRRVNLQPHLVLMSDAKQQEELLGSGNDLLICLLGSKIYLSPTRIEETDYYNRVMKNIADKIRKEHNESCYVIPLGGSDGVGVWGDIQCFDELLKQGVLDQFDDVVCGVGSGSTIAGIAIGNYLNGSKLKCHGMVITQTADALHEHIDGMMEELGIDVKSRDILNIYDCYNGDGYDIPHKPASDFMMKAAARTGIVLNPVYTAKMAWGMVEMMKSTPEQFKGRRVLFMHTGGIFGLTCDGEIIKDMPEFQDSITFL